MSEWTIRPIGPNDWNAGYRWMWPDRWLAICGGSYYTAITRRGAIRKARRDNRRSERARRLEERIR